MSIQYGKYNYAICRRLSRAVVARNSANQDTIEPPESTNGSATNNKKNKKAKNAKISRVDKHLPVNYERANEEMSNFIATLRMLNIDVIELGPDDDLNYESVFVGDVAVAINGLALICKPHNRIEEVKEIRQIIKSELNLPIIEINDESAMLNGGDVLWTGREIFIGLSNETNEAGARAVAAAFPEYSVTPVKVPPKDSLRLKSYITMAGPDILCVNRSAEAQAMLRRMEREASFKYKLITIDDEQGSNVVFVNGTLVHRNDLSESGTEVLQEKIDYSRVPVKMCDLLKNHPFHGISDFCLLIRNSNRVI